MSAAALTSILLVEDDPAFAMILRDLVREMESAIAIFEPRLKRAKVRMEAVEGSYRSLKFVIEGLLCMDPAPEPVRFDTVLELGKGEYEIKGADLAQ